MPGQGDKYEQERKSGGNVRAFILAAGTQEGPLKQLLDVGEVFIERIIRQCKRHVKPTEIIVVTWRDEIRDLAFEKNVCVFEPKDRAFTCESILSTHNLWREENVFLLGDVYYTKNTFDSIMEAEGVKFFGHSMEIFGFRFPQQESEKMKRHLRDILKVARKEGDQRAGKVRKLQEKYSSSKRR